jgi:hypothetical protein
MDDLKKPDLLIEMYLRLSAQMYNWNRSLAIKKAICFEQSLNTPSIWNCSKLILDIEIIRFASMILSSILGSVKGGILKDFKALSWTN